MPRKGEAIIRSNTEQILFLQTSSDTNGELLEVEVSYKPNSQKPPEHYHPYQEEVFEVLAGTVRAKIGDEGVVDYHAGDRFLIPPGVPHWMHAVGDEPGRLHWEIRPAMRTEDFFETIWSLARDGKIGERGPSLLQGVVIGREYRDEFRLTSPPFILQRLAFLLLGPIAKMLGYRG